MNTSGEFIGIFIGLMLLLFVMYKYVSSEDKKKMNKMKNLTDVEHNEEDETTKYSSSDNYMISGRTSDILKYCEEIDCKLND